MTHHYRFWVAFHRPKPVPRDYPSTKSRVYSCPENQKKKKTKKNTNEPPGTANAEMGFLAGET